MKTYLLVLFVICNAFGQTQKTKTDLEKLNLKGNVKSIKSGFIKTTYNSSGFEELIETWFDLDSTKLVFKTYLIRDKNNLLLEVQKKHASTNNISELINYTYNKNNQLIQIKKTKYRQMESKTGIKIETYFETSNFSYDLNNNLISKKNEVNDEHENDFTFTCKYNNNILIEKKEEVTNRVFYIHKYNKLNQEIQLSLYDKKENKIFSTHEYIYDVKGNLIEDRNFNKELNIKSAVKNYYDENNLLIKKLNGHEIFYKYKFDNNGNWIKKEIKDTWFDMSYQESIYYEDRIIEYY